MALSSIEEAIYDSDYYSRRHFATLFENENSHRQYSSEARLPIEIVAYRLALRGITSLCRSEAKVLKPTMTSVLLVGEY